MVEDEGRRKERRFIYPSVDDQLGRYNMQCDSMLFFLETLKRQREESYGARRVKFWRSEV